ncbi:MAG: DNA lyase, partial [Candidatus Omnitrophica bacterium]|nr:DNA lyase [Candidatus Omnitrophota bacterium]
MNPAIRYLIYEYNKRRSEIKNRLKEFTLLHKGKDEKIFKELSFCLLTANANALKCDEAIRDLEKAGLLLKGKVHQIRPKIKGKVRFHNKKASFLVGARRLFENGKRIDLKRRLDFKDPVATREWLVANIKGMGYKEASHFLRNIGLGKNIAILDRHILKNLK